MMHINVHIIFNNIFMCFDTERNSMIWVNFVHTDMILDNNLLRYCIGYMFELFCWFIIIIV